MCLLSNPTNKTVVSELIVKIDSDECSPYMESLLSKAFR